MVHKCGLAATPDELRFAMKDSYEFPEFYGSLWSIVLEIHAKKVKELIDKLTDRGSCKGYVEIILR